jgi:hypothetical protein
VFDPDTIDTILAVTPAVICAGVVLWASALIAPRTTKKDTDRG